MLEYVEEGEPLNLPLPDRRVSAYVQSHFYLDEFPQSTEPENPRPHTQLGAQLEDDYVSADDGYQGRPFPPLRRPSFLGPGPETDSESGPFAGTASMRPGRFQQHLAAASAAGWARRPCEEARES